MKDYDNFSIESGSSEEIKSAIEKIDLAVAKIQSELSAPANTAVKAIAAPILGGFKKKLLISFVAITTLLFSLLLSTHAYFVASTSSNHNRIVAGGIDVSLFDYTDSSLTPDDDGAFAILPGYEVDKSYYAKNNGRSPIYVRAKLESLINLCEESKGREGEIDYSLILYSIDSENWIEKDGYHYYKNPLYYNDSTTNFLSKIKFSENMGNLYKDSTIKITVYLEILQASNNVSNVLEASGWTSVTEGGAA